ncbi:MAG: TraX family protein [Pseudoflavonifractor sp.]|nr:TraX family protein [Pseudoflavonifractor sp.]
MDATKLKYLAAFSMLLDHIGALFFPCGSVFYLALRLAGRLAFPVFAWFIAEGCHKTGDSKNYLIRLGLFALIAEGPYLLVFHKGGGLASVLVTFFLVVGSMMLFERLRSTLPLPTALLPLLCAMVLAELLGSDYGLPGVLLVAGLYLIGENHSKKLLFVGLWCVCFYLLWQPAAGLLAWLPAGLLTPCLGEIVMSYLLRNLLSQLGYALVACLSIPLLAQYNGARGVGHRWFFYWFYPLHLLVLFLISLISF